MTSGLDSLGSEVTVQSGPCARRDGASFAGLAVLLLLGLALTLTGIRSGLARGYFPAESVTADAARDLWLDRTLVAPTLIYPALPVYAQAAGQKLLACWRGGSLAASPGRNWSLADWHLGARLSSPLLFLIAIAGTFLLGRSLAGHFAGGMAAAVLIGAPLAVKFMRMARPEPALMACGAIGLLATYAALSKPTPGRFALAGLIAGLAGAAKYNGAALLLAPLIALALAPRERRRRCIGWTAAGFLFGFALGIPLAFFEPARLWSVWQEQWDHYAFRGQPGRSGAFNLPYYLGRLWRQDLGAIATLLAALGAAVSLRRRDRTALPVLGIGCAYLLLFSVLKLQAAHNLLLIFPALAVLAGVGAKATTEWLRRFVPRGAALLVLAATVLPGWWRCAEAAHQLTFPDTRDLMGHYLATALPPGTRVALLGLSVTNQDFGAVRGETYPLTARPTPAELVTDGFQVAVITSNQYERFLKRPETAPRRTAYLRRFMKELEGNLIRRFDPDPRTRPGPTVLIYALDPVGPKTTPDSGLMDLEMFTSKRGRTTADGALESASAGGRGFFAISPRIVLQSGRYRALCLIDAPGAPADGRLGIVEFRELGSSTRLGSADLVAETLGPLGSAVVAFDFEVQQPTLAKFRAASRGRHQVILRAVLMERLSHTAPFDWPSP